MRKTASVGDITGRLARIVGEANVSESADGREWDALGPGRGFRGIETLEPQPLCLVRPGTTEEVAAVVTLAAQRQAGVVPYGGGSGLMGGAVAVRPSVVVDMARMDRVLEVGRTDQTARAQAGVVLSDLDAALEPEGLMLGHDPWTVSVATVGGTISTDSLGYRGGKFGSMGAQVLGLTAVLPDGTVMEVRPVWKASVGPDLRRLFIGGEGCFGIVTEATLRVFPRPDKRALMAYEFATFEAGFEAVLGVQATGLAPALMDFGEEFWQEGEKPVKARLYLGFEGFAEGVAAEEGRARRICDSSGGRDVGEEEAREFWEHRHDIGERFAERRRSGTRTAPFRGGFDYVHVALAPSRVLDYRGWCREAVAGRGLRLMESGIWCHPGLFSAVFMDNGGAGPEAMSGAVDELLGLAQEMGGSMEYCHGVGIRLAHLMAGEHGRGLDVLRAIKRALDPLGIMNPGKLAL
ncbi:MAG TPA: FAD-binding oxidoreductase [Dehalococcoidia bacterium]|nr:FAD-binding oxidoreductase [Dehalococcoidia bacterium]